MNEPVGCMEGEGAWAGERGALFGDGEGMCQRKKDVQANSK